jgi:hypothetical protein
MSDFDDQLRRALQRKAPPAGFAERVMARVPEAGPGASLFSRLLEAWRRPALRWALAGAAFVLLGGGGWLGRQQYERHQAQAAKREVMLALQITREELHLAQAKTQDLYLTGPRRHSRPELP